MYERLLALPEDSFFLFGPRGVGKTAWLDSQLATAGPRKDKAIFFDLLEGDVFRRLNAAPERLTTAIPPGHKGWVVIDEVQRVPELLNEVHRLISKRAPYRFALTGSSARKLRKRGVNLLAGRAFTNYMHPLTSEEVGKDFDLGRALQFGMLPRAVTDKNPQRYLDGYVTTYLREEVQQEGVVRRLDAYGRFLEAASFSQAQVLNMASVARDCGLSARVAEEYFAVTEDLLLSVRLPVFQRRAKRKLVGHPKFFFFDTGVFRTIRPRGPLDEPGTVTGPALETLFLQHLRAINDGFGLRYQISYWRTGNKEEVDFVLYGERGLWGFEITTSDRVRDEDLKGLRLFLADYPMARARILYGGRRRYFEGKIEIVPVTEALTELSDWLRGRGS